MEALNSYIYYYTVVIIMRNYKSVALVTALAAALSACNRTQPAPTGKLGAIGAYLANPEGATPETKKQVLDYFRNSNTSAAMLVYASTLKDTVKGMRLPPEKEAALYSCAGSLAASAVDYGLAVKGANPGLHASDMKPGVSVKIPAARVAGKNQPEDTVTTGLGDVARYVFDRAREDNEALGCKPSEVPLLYPAASVAARIIAHDPDFLYDAGWLANDLTAEYENSSTQGKQTNLQKTQK